MGTLPNTLGAYFASAIGSAFCLLFVIVFCFGLGLLGDENV